ncbi:MAG: hypothetical protein IPF82_03285 [Blastocatellia bacterium]|nr:hypothetical protein [Blastocatellia bacterium]
MNSTPEYQAPPDSNGAGRSARFHSPTGLAIDTRPDGGLFVADSANHCIRRVSFTGVVSDALGTPTLPGVMLDDEQQLSAAKFDGPQGLALLGRDFIVADTNNHALFYADLDADGTGVIYRIGGSPGSAGIVDGPRTGFAFPSSDRTGRQQCRYARRGR